MRRSLGLLAAASALTLAIPAQQPASDPAARAKQLHADAIVLDTHIDVTQRLMIKGWDFFARHKPPEPGARGLQSGPDAASHVDYPRMREGGLDGLFFSI